MQVYSPPPRSPIPKRSPVPQWVINSDWIFFVRDRIIFERQRKLRPINGQPYLLDVNDRPYPLNLCEALRIEHFERVCTIVTPHAPLTLRPEPRLGRYGFILTDGFKRVGVKFPPKTPERIAAELLAKAFSGEVIEGVEL
jgi:hypothetical protein